MLNIILIPCYYFINDRNQFREIDLKNCALYFFIEIKSMLRKKVDEQSDQNIQNYYTGYIVPNVVKPLYIVCNKMNG